MRGLLVPGLQTHRWQSQTDHAADLHLFSLVVVEVASFLRLWSLRYAGFGLVGEECGCMLVPFLPLDIVDESCMRFEVGLADLAVADSVADYS